VGKKIVILGSTGSIGRRTLDVIQGLSTVTSSGSHASSGSSDGWRVVGLAAGGRWQELAKQARQFLPRRVAIADEKNLTALKESLADLPIEVSGGEAAVESLAESPEADFVICAIVGARSILPVLRGIEAGKDIGLASKEALVLAGEKVISRAKEKHVHILPVDSEHSAIFQCLQGGRRSEVRRIFLTASGGPFRSWDKERIRRATVEEALNHPTWSMGRKITIDSATMMNKALEIIEAKYLFDVSVDTIDVVIHPESIVHSLVEFCDGSVIGQFSNPDMALPIQYALTWPERREGISKRLDLTEIGHLSFYKPDFDRFPSLRLAYEVASRGGTSGAVFNAANEEAVEAFLAGKIVFGEITEMVERVLSSHRVIGKPELTDLLESDRWARNEVNKCIRK